MGKKNLPEIKISFKKLVRIFQISLLVITLSLFPGRKISLFSNPITADNTNQTEKKNIKPESAPPPIPVLVPNVLYPEISAQGILIKDLDSGVVMYAKNEKQPLFPASTTKIMTE